MTTTLQFEPEQVPLRFDAYGVVRVGGTRVSLDSVMASFDDGAGPEEILDSYPSLALADIYAIIAYYLRHEDEVRAYLAHQEELAERAREENEKLYPSDGLRERLLARLAERERRAARG